MATSCPDINSYDVTIDSQTFRCAHHWQGSGSPDPNMACNPTCQSSGTSAGVEVPQDEYHANGL